jgi:hypothetical protein
MSQGWASTRTTVPRPRVFSPRPSLVRVSSTGFPAVLSTSDSVSSAGRLRVHSSIPCPPVQLSGWGFCNGLRSSARNDDQVHWDGLMTNRLRSSLRQSMSRTRSSGRMTVMRSGPGNSCSDMIIALSEPWRRARPRWRSEASVDGAEFDENHLAVDAPIFGINYLATRTCAALEKSDLEERNEDIV